MKNPKLRVAARTTKKPKTTFSRFTATPHLGTPASYGAARALNGLCGGAPDARLAACSPTQEVRMSRVVHFEIQADDVERAKSFYAAVFDWSFQDYGEFTGATYWGIVTGPEDEPGINGGLLPRPAPAPSAGQGTNGYVCTMGVGDYDETERRILAA